MEFYLSQDNDRIQLPVPPGSFEVSNEINVSTFNVELAGEISFIGKKKLSSITIQSFFPAQKYSFCQTSPLSPYDYVKKIKGWQDSGKPIQLIITETDVNMICSINKFTHSEQAGTRDVDFTLELMEYRVVT